MTDEKQETAVPEAPAKSKAKSKPKPKAAPECEDGVCSAPEIALPVPVLGMHGFLRQGNEIAVAQIVHMQGKGKFYVTYTKFSTLGRPAWSKDVTLGLQSGCFWPDAEVLLNEMKIERAKLATGKAD